MLGIFIVSSVSASLSLYLSVSPVYLYISPKPNLESAPPPPHSLFPDKKFPVALVAQTLMDIDFYVLD
jgi:hypothetical protein